MLREINKKYPQSVINNKLIKNNDNKKVYFKTIYKSFYNPSIIFIIIT